MNKFLGGPEAPEKIPERQERYYRRSQTEVNLMFVIVVGPERVPAGSIGYWEHNWQGEVVWETGWSVLPENGIHAPRGSGLRIPAGSHHALQRLVIGSACGKNFSLALEMTE